jgi:hypothetical protein
MLSRYKFPFHVSVAAGIGASVLDYDEKPIAVFLKEDDAHQYKEWCHAYNAGKLRIES